MIGCIARRELTEIWRDGRLRWAALAVALLLATAVAVSVSENTAARAERAAATAAMRAQWLAQGVKNPHSAAHYGVFAFTPRTALAFLDPGVEPYVGQAVWLEAHRQNDARYRPAEDATAAARFGALTPASVLQLVVPLLVVLFAAPSFAGERESGVLRFTLSIGVRPVQLFLGKALGIGAATAIATAPGIMLAVVAALFSGTVSMDVVARSGLLAIAYVVYLGTVLTLALAASAWAASTRRALAISLALWTACGLVVPRAAADVVTAMIRTPSTSAFTLAVEADRAASFNAHDPNPERVQQMRLELIARYSVTRVEDLPINIAGVLLQADEEEGHRVFDHHWGALWATLDRQDAMLQSASLLAAPLAMRTLSMALAGTDGTAHRAFMRHAEHYRRAMIDILHGDLIMQSRTGQEYLAGPALWARVPPFAYAVPPVTAAIARQTRAIVALGVWALGAGGAAALILRRLGTGVAG